MRGFKRFLKKVVKKVVKKTVKTIVSVAKVPCKIVKTTGRITKLNRLFHGKKKNEQKRNENNKELFSEDDRKLIENRITTIMEVVIVEPAVDQPTNSANMMYNMPYEEPTGKTSATLSDLCRKIIVSKNEIRNIQPMEIRNIQPMEIRNIQPMEIRNIQPMEIRNIQSMEVIKKRFNRTTKSSRIKISNNEKQKYLKRNRKNATPKLKSNRKKDKINMTQTRDRTNTQPTYRRISRHVIPIMKLLAKSERFRIKRD